MRCVVALLAGFGLISCTPPAFAQSGGTVAILMPGAGGVHPADFLIRNSSRIGAGIATKVTTSPSQAAEMTRAEKQKGRKVVLVGMSRGALHVGQALAAGASLAAAAEPWDLDATVSVDELDAACVAWLERREPFGQGNPEPLFGSRKVRLEETPTVVGMYIFSFQ